MFNELTLDPSRENDTPFVSEHAVLALLLAGLVFLFGYSAASIPSGIIASFAVVVGALLCYDDSTVRRGGTWHSLLFAVVLLNVVFMAYPLLQQEHHLWNVLPFIPAPVYVLLLGPLVALGALISYAQAQGARIYAARMLLVVTVPFSVFLIAHPLVDRANGVPQSLLPVPAGVLLLLVALWKLAAFPKTHEAPRD